MAKHILLQIFLSLGVLVIVGLLFRLYNSLVATPRRLLRVLEQQGIRGPKPALFTGNISEMKVSRISVAGPPALHNSGDTLSFLEKWRQQYGDMYTFSLCNKPVLFVNKYDVIKELITCTSLDLGKPSFQAEDYEPLFGDGIITSSGKTWASQKKILAPELYPEKVKGMINVMQQSAMMLIDSWKGIIDAEGGRAEIKIDDHLKQVSSETISRACFGCSFEEGEQILQTLKSLQQVTSKKGLPLGIPGLRYIPTTNNRKAWRLEKELRKLILNLVRQKNEENTEKNMLQMLLEGVASTNLNPDAKEKFIIDNIKNIYIAGYDSTATAACWCLMLLASNPDWQDRVREEVVGVCNGQVPDGESIRQMKQMTMVINESLRLYPPGIVIARETLNELKLGSLHIPKGVIIWILVSTLYTDPDLWGSDSYKFRPERFANGTAGACKLPYLFMPFGVGPRLCLGMNLAMVEIKILLALILSNFSFSLSPNYVHSPMAKLLLEPANGVDLVIEKLKLP